MTRTARWGITAGAAVVLFAAGILFFIWVLTFPPQTKASGGATSAKLTIQTVPQLGYGEHALWVSYLAEQPDGHWHQSTIFQVPANTTVHVTVYNFDTNGPLRNQDWGKVTGTVGGIEYWNGKPLSLSNANGDSPSAPGHTFTIPSLGIDVPLVGINPDAKNQCSVAPCTLNYTHETLTFDIKTPGPGIYRWQCFVPCGLSYLDGNGGPMSTLGFMGGFLKVVSS